MVLMEAVIRPYVDAVFKHIFGSEANKETVLRSFLNDLLKKTELSVLDIAARTETGKLLNIEVQVKNHYDMIPRTLYYWSRIYSDQLQEGVSYLKLKKTITINIVNFKLLENEELHNIFQLKNIESNQQLTDLLEIHFLELSKIDRVQQKESNAIVKWAKFIAGLPQEEWLGFSENNPGLKQAFASLRYFYQDKTARYLYEAQLKGIRDNLSAISSHKERGRAEGLAEGRVEGRVEGLAEGLVEGQKKGVKLMAKKLLQTKEYTMEELERLTGLTKSELKELE
jgi:predicted transposase/invertase (TIGR01784 family)